MTMLPIWLLFVLLVIVVPLLVTGLQVLVRRQWPGLPGERDDVAGYLIAIVGVIYAVLLAFVVVVTWQQFSQASNIVGQEASALRGLYRETVHAWDPEVRERVQSDVRDYAAAVVAWERQAMGDVASRASRHGGPRPHRRGAPGHAAGGHGHPAGVRRRRGRPTGSPTCSRSAPSASTSSVRGSPGVLWVALVLGGVVTIGFGMIFGLRSTFLHLFMTGSLAATIGVLLFVAIAIDQPFLGDVAVRPAPLERVLSDFSR